MNAPTLKNAKTQDAERAGFLLIDKPIDWTSHDVVNRIRKLTDVRKVGHAGTLDPFATGLLLVGVRRKATREMRHLVGLDKVYEATFVLGAHSTTGDPEGEITSGTFETLPERADIEEAIRTFVGEIKQRPPAYSAIKIRGKKLYEFAREGKQVNAGTRDVTVHAFEITGAVERDKDCLRVPVRIHCSSGTYIRALARDLGDNLGVGGYTKTLRRTAIGPFTIDESVTLNGLSHETVFTHLLPIEKILTRLSIK